MSTAHGDRPPDPLAAVTHPDPYPYYAELVATRPIARNDSLGLWVACSAATVTDVLTNPACLVRPSAEPVPRPLLGSPGGAIFGRLVRMNDGARHAALKPAVSAVTARLETSIGEPARRWAEHLSATLKPAGDLEGLNAFAFQLSAYTLASALGITPDALAPTVTRAGDFARSLAPAATSEQLTRGNDAAGQLLDQFRAMLDAHTSSGSPLGDLRRELTRTGNGESDDVVANGIGFLTQAYEATAGLIGNTLVTLGRYRDALIASRSVDGALRAIVGEVVRYDPPVHNTRRFLARDALVAGQPMKAGDAVLVVLAAANRDPMANREPGRFDPARLERQAFTFGLGPHACPGEAVAITIAEAGVRRLLTEGLEPERLIGHLSYRPSANTRVPIFR